MTFELWPFEIGREWKVKESCVCETPHGDVCIFYHFVHDGDTGVPNWKEMIRSVVEKLIVPIVHDFLYWHRKFADGRIATRRQADDIYYYLCRHSNNWFRRQLAGIRYWGVRKLGACPWNSRPGPVALPQKYEYLYGTSEEAVAARAKLPRYVVRDGRIAYIPAPK